MNLYDGLSLVEFLIAVPSFLFTIFVFFNDPIRRWRFFGYRPTAIAVIFDPKLKKFLLIKVKGRWGFVQGGIYGLDLYTTIEQTLGRELGLSSFEYQLRNVAPLGTVKIHDKSRMERATVGTISIKPGLSGKGYIACFVFTDLAKIKRKIRLGAGIEGFGILSAKQALGAIKSNRGEESKKIKMLARVIESVERKFF